MIDKSLLKKKGRILELKKKCKEIGKDGRSIFEYSWMRNIRFFLGDHWITYSKSKRQWVGIEFGDNYTPKPITNKFASSINTVKSVLIQQDPRTIITPTENTDQDIATAEIGDSLVPVLARESGLKNTRKVAAPWLVLTGNVFIHNYYDMSSEHGSFFVPYDMCAACGSVVPPDLNACPKCQGQNYVKGVTPDGKEIGKFFNRGKLCSEAVSPFEMYFNQEITDWWNIREVVRSKRVPIADAKSYYPEIKETLSEDKPDDDSGDFWLRSLAFASEGSGNMGGGAGQKSPSTVLDYFHRLPDDEFPQGIYACLNGDEIAELTPLPTKGKGDKYFLPYVYVGMHKVPGRFWHRTFADDLVPKQVQRNKTEALIELSIMRMGKPDWTVPDGSGVDQLTGEPGQVINYKPGLGGAEPKKLPGSEVPASNFKFLESIDNAFEDIAKTYDVLKGQSPSANIPFASLKLLEERGFSNHLDMIKNWEDGNTEITIQQLEIARTNFTEERTHTIKKDNGDWETKSFLGADLMGGVEVQTEAGSTVPKSQAAQQAAIREDLKSGIIDVSSPKVKHKILERLGHADLGSEIDEDVKDATAEWKDFVESVNEFPQDQAKWVVRPRFGIDNELVHYKDAVSRAKSPEFFLLAPEAQNYWIEHANIHKVNLDNEMMAQQASAQANTAKNTNKAPTFAAAPEKAASPELAPAI